MIVRDHGKVPPVLGPGGRCALVVLACADAREADAISLQLAQMNAGCLVAYRRAEELQRNVPLGRVAMVILATEAHPQVMRHVLRWLRQRWPRCPVTVVGNAGCGADEMVAREGGATYLTRPVAPEQWRALLEHALGVEYPAMS